MSNNQLYPGNVVENVIKHFDSLILATNVKDILEHYGRIAQILQYENGQGLKNFFKLKNALNVQSLSKWDRVASILKTLDQKTNQKEYSVRNKILTKKILVIGGGISGLRVAIELLLLGAKVICVEKRNEFSRNNVIHLWPNVINDMYTFEAKRFYGQFCVGSIDHISIRQLQLILLKIALIYGLKFVTNVTFDEICPRIIEPCYQKCNKDTCLCCCHIHGFGGGAYAHFSSSSSSVNENTLIYKLNKESFDVIIGCDGRRNTFSRYFPRNNRRGKLAIGLTANYLNRRTEEEAHCREISGISRIYNQKFFKDLQDETGIELENLVYYRDETHYFVMTATKASLLRRGVLKTDFSDSHQLLSLRNIDTANLMRYSKDAAKWSSKLQRLEFAKNSNNMPDVALFDFTSMYSATNASCAKKIYLKCCDNNVHDFQNSRYTLMLLCGDSLLEPFWPTGSGAGRGFLSALDAAWTVAQWYSNVTDESNNIDAMLNVISRREYIYRLLAQTNPENITIKNFTLDPQTRYKNLNLRDSKVLQEIKQQARNLIIDKLDLDVKNYVSSYELKRARRATVGIDPQDVLKAKDLSQKSLSSWNDFPQIGSGFSNASINSSQSSNIGNLPKYDNLSMKIIERKPKNCEQQGNVGYTPRNNAPEFHKKNYQAKNHFFNLDDNINNSELENFSSSTKENQCSEDKIFSQSLYSFDRSDKENSYCDLNKFSSIDSETKLVKSFIEREKKHKTFNSEMYMKNRKAIEQFVDPVKFNAETTFRNNNKTKKSPFILKKGQYLEQKFEEQNKPYKAKLSKVGKIESEDWNVKIWNSNNAFNPKVEEKQNLVLNNSKELLQSRLKQYNDNLNISTNENNSSSKYKKSTDYVDFLSKELSQKFDNPKPKSKIELSNNGKNQSLDIPIEISYPKQEINYKKPINHESLLEKIAPLGECKRCNGNLTTSNRVTVSGQNYHKTCLICKHCSITLRQDEIVNEDFTCKVCLKSRLSTLSSDSRHSFFSTTSLNKLEAMEKFLINNKQIDLRERAEFELVDGDNELDTNNAVNININESSSDSSLNNSSNIGTNVLESKLLYNDSHPETICNKSENELDSSESEIIDGVPNSSSVDSDTNYTDDEYSESDDKSKIDSDENGDLSIFINENNAVDIKHCLIDNCTAEINCNIDSNTDNSIPCVSANNDHRPDDSNFSLPDPAISADNVLPCFSTNSDSPLLFHDDSNTNIPNRAFGVKETCGPRNFPKREPSFDLSSSKNINKTSFPLRYHGQFTEKLYRTMSQPTLNEQTNLIQRKFNKSPALQPLSQEDFPFADSDEDLPSKIFTSSMMSSQAPVVNIEDI